MGIDTKIMFLSVLETKILRYVEIIEKAHFFRKKSKKKFRKKRKKNV